MNARRVPAALQESLLSGVAALDEQTPVCVPPVPASSPAVVPSPSHGHGHGHEKHHGQGEGD